jgi:hypothetical protein
MPARTLARRLPARHRPAPTLLLVARLPACHPAIRLASSPARPLACSPACRLIGSRDISHGGLVETQIRWGVAAASDIVHYRQSHVLRTRAQTAYTLRGLLPTWLSRLRQRAKGASVLTAPLLFETAQDGAVFHGRSVRARGDGFRPPCSSHADDSAFVFLSSGKL